MKLVKKSVVVLGVLSLVLTLSSVESFAKPFVKKASKKVEKTVTITSKKDLMKKFNKNLLKLKGKFTFKLSTSVVNNQKALVKSSMPV